MARLPKQWWDIVLDGGVYRLDVRDMPYSNIATLRSVIYREAESRYRNVATHKTNIGTLVIQAWGSQGLPDTLPNLAGAAAQAAPTLTVPATPPRTHECDCGQGPTSHPLTCSIWGSPAPGTQQQT